MNDYLQSSQAFTDSIMINALLLSMVHLVTFQELGNYLITYFHRRKLAAAMTHIVPVVERRIEERKMLNLSKRPVDAIEWTIKLQEVSVPTVNAREVALNVLHNLWAGSTAPGGLVAQMVTQVLMEPKYLEPLREEASRSVSIHGWTDKAFGSMTLMDNFILEIGRLYPVGSVGSAHTVITEPFSFHDGLVLPVGSRIGFPSKAYMRDSANFQDPLKFDGFRFARLEDQEQKGAQDPDRKWGATTITKANLA